MAKDTSLENGSAFDMTYPQGKVVDANFIDNFTITAKKALKYRMDAEHLWPSLAESGGDANYASAAGNHRASAGRCDRKSWAELQGDADFGQAYNNLVTIGDEYKLLKHGAIVQITDGIGGSNDEVAGIVWTVRNDGTLVPLVKHIRGMVFQSGCLVKQRLLDGFNARTIGTNGVVFTDADGVPDTAKVGFDIWKPYDDGNPSELVWPVKLWNGDPETYLGAHTYTAGKKETLAIDVEDYGYSNGGVRIKLNRDGISFDSDLASPPSSYLFDGVKVKEHTHTGGTDGAALSYGSIDNLDANRITHFAEGMLTPGTLTIGYNNWVKIGEIPHDDWNLSTAGTSILREISFSLQLDNLSGTVDNRAGQAFSIVFTSADQGTSVAWNAITPVDAQFSSMLIPNSSNSATISGHVGFKTPGGGGPGTSDNMYIYARNPAASRSASVSFLYSAKVWKR